MNTGATLDAGRALARNAAVTLDTNTIKAAGCAPTGTRVGTAHAKPGRTKFKITVDPRRQGPRMHRVIAAVKFTPASRARTTIRRLTYRRTSRPQGQPRFTG